MNVKPIPGIQNYPVTSATESADPDRRRERHAGEDAEKKKKDAAKTAATPAPAAPTNAEAEKEKSENSDDSITRQPVDSGKMIEMLFQKKTSKISNNNAFKTVKELSSDVPVKKVNRIL